MPSAAPCKGGRRRRRRVDGTPPGAAALMGGWLAAAGVSGACAVALGAYAAHGLDPGEPRTLHWVETAVRYQMWHALALVGLVALMPRSAGGARRLLHVAAGAFLAGTMLFSGSLYLMALADWPDVVVVTPIGGGVLILGWVVLAGCGFALWRRRAGG